MDWEEVAVADSAVVEVVEVEDLTAAATVLEDLAAVPAVDSVAAADSAAEEDLLDFAAVMVEDGAAQNGFLELDQEHVALEQHGAAVEEMQAIHRPRLDPWVLWAAPAAATRDRLERTKFQIASCIRNHGS